MNVYKVEKVKLKKSGVKGLLRSEDVMSELKANVQNVGNGKTYASFVGFDRCHVLVEDPDGNRTDNS